LQLNDGRTLDARVVGADPSADVAVLKVDAGNLPVVCTDDSNKVQVGDDVVAIGNALALEGGLSVTRGIISGPPRPGSEIGTAIETVLQTDAAINPGKSGGPLVDSTGCVIGINTAVASGSGSQPAQNVGFAIPISSAKPVIDDIKAGRKPAFLGVGTTDLTPELKSQLGVSVNDGAAVTDVTSGSPADDAGLKQLPPQGHVKVVYLGAVAPHWEVHGVFGDGRLIDEFRQRALARLQLLPPHDPQFRRNRERVARDAERERLILEWDLGYEESDT